MGLNTWGTPAQFEGGRKGTPHHHLPEMGQGGLGRAAGTAWVGLCAPLLGPCPFPGDSCLDPARGEGGPRLGKERGAPSPLPGSRDLSGRHRTLPYRARHLPPPSQAALYRCPLQVGLWPGFTLPAETGKRLQETLGPRPWSDTVRQPRSLRRDPEQPSSPSLRPLRAPRGWFGGCRTLRSWDGGQGAGTELERPQEKLLGAMGVCQHPVLPGWVSPFCAHAWPCLRA